MQEAQFMSVRIHFATTAFIAILVPELGLGVPLVYFHLRQLFPSGFVTSQQNFIFLFKDATYEARSTSRANIDNSRLFFVPFQK